MTAPTGCPTTIKIETPRREGEELSITYSLVVSLERQVNKICIRQHRAVLHLTAVHASWDKNLTPVGVEL
jgi:hypothetical protein